MIRKNFSALLHQQFALDSRCVPVSSEKLFRSGFPVRSSGELPSELPNETQAAVAIEQSKPDSPQPDMRVAG